VSSGVGHHDPQQIATNNCIPTLAAVCGEVRTSFASVAVVTGAMTGQGRGSSFIHDELWNYFNGGIEAYVAILARLQLIHADRRSLPEGIHHSRAKRLMGTLVVLVRSLDAITHH